VRGGVRCSEIVSPRPRVIASQRPQCHRECNRTISLLSSMNNVEIPPFVTDNSPSIFPGNLPHPRLVQTGRVRMTWRGMVEGAALALRHRIAASPRPQCHREPFTAFEGKLRERSHRIRNESRCVPPYAAWGQNNSEQHCHRERMRTISPNMQCILPRYTARSRGASASHCQREHQ
jgi:hypothetical protein